MIVNGSSLIMAAPIKDMTWDKHKEHGVSYGMSEAGYDIRIKQRVAFSKLYDKHVVCVLPGTVTEGLVEDPVWSEGRFAIASAIEEFQMPDNLVGIVHDKSTWARRGLSVFNTVIEPGWNGFLTLELVYHGNTELVIPAGAGIAQVVFHRTTDRMQYTGKYQNQENAPVAARES